MYTGVVYSLLNFHLSSDCDKIKKPNNIGKLDWIGEIDVSME